jgi:hypothetical protein
MPRGDRTGPAGMGPMTGRGLGYCAGYGAPGYMDPAPGLGRGRGRGWWGAGRGWGGGGGRGWRHWYYATGLPGWARYGYPPFWGYAPYPQPPSAEEETEFLKNQAEALKRELDAIAQRLDELEKGA